MGKLQRLASLFGRREVSEDVRVFGVGAAKTGTHSIASLFDGTGLAVEHEPDVGELLELVLAHAEHVIDRENYRRALRTIIENNGLKINVSQINGYVIEDLYSLFPRAKYVLTVRDAEGWVRSLLNHVVTRESEPGNVWDRFRHLRFSRGFAFRPEDEWLEAQNFYSLDSLLDYWQAHTLKVLETVPEPQLCIVPTREIGESKIAIYDFVGLDRAPFEANEHAYQGAYTAEVDRLPAAYLRERSAFYSDAFMREARSLVGPHNLEVLSRALYPNASDYGHRDPAERGAATRDLMAARSTDLERWAHVASQTDERWDGRAKLAASMIGDQSSVLDLGCGAMPLERCLPAGVRYIPSDCVRRDDRTIVCDLNVDPLPEVEAGCVVALGLFEYIHDVPTLLKALAARFDVIVCSYIPLDTVGAIEERRSTGWVNDYSTAAFEALLADAGATLETKQKYLDRALLWRARGRAGGNLPRE